MKPTKISKLVSRFLRATWWATLITTIALVLWNEPTWVSPAIKVIAFVLQMMMYLAFAILQFVAIFWFMAKTKTEIILPGDAKSVNFESYWGQPNLKRLVRQWIQLLSDRKQFGEMGGKYINGLLLYGPPGTGKSLLAKCMAGESGIPFISTEGSSFQAMFIGVAPMKMIAFVGKAKSLAREYGASIAFIDELDSVGASRGNVMGGGGGGGALTRLLYEMDGIENKNFTEKLRDKLYMLFGKTPPAKNWHVLFMGSSNRPDVLDPALTRPGRFDQKVQVDAPDKGGRREVIEGYLGRIKHDDSINIEAIVEDTPGYTPARIAAAITKDSVRIALFNGRRAVSQTDIDLALQEQALGIEQPIEEWDANQRKQVAYHEAGHAVAQHYLMPDQRIVRLSIIRRGGALGYMMPVDKVEIYSQPLERIAAHVMVGLAGHVATRMFMGEDWTGASGDFQSVRHSLNILYSLGYFGPPTKEALSPETDKAFPKLWKKLEKKTAALLGKHRDEVEGLANLLIEKSDLSHDEVMAVLEPHD